LIDLSFGQSLGERGQIRLSWINGFLVTIVILMAHDLNLRALSIGVAVLSAAAPVRKLSLN
jgi:hypothetical protein